MQTFAEDYWIITVVGLSLDGKTLVTVDNNNYIKIWDATSGKSRNAIAGPIYYSPAHRTNSFDCCGGFPEETKMSRISSDSGSPSIYNTQSATANKW